MCIRWYSEPSIDSLAVWPQAQWRTMESVLWWRTGRRICISAVAQAQHTATDLVLLLLRHCRIVCDCRAAPCPLTTSEFQAVDCVTSESCWSLVLDYW